MRHVARYLVLAQAAAFQSLLAPNRAAAHCAGARLRASTTPAGWEDLSNGDGECVVRRLGPTPPGAATPPPGAVCVVRWTCWLAERRGAWWTRGERVGTMQPNATLEFTLGGAAAERRSRPSVPALRSRPSVPAF